MQNHRASSFGLCILVALGGACANTLEVNGLGEDDDAGTDTAGTTGDATVDDRGGADTREGTDGPVGADTLSADDTLVTSDTNASTDTSAGTDTLVTPDTRDSGLDATPTDVCTPVAESCNGLDDDCNGYADDGLLPSTCGLGICKSTGTSCAASSCTIGDARLETCDGLDENCNGTIDDGVTRHCYDGVPASTEGVGVCRAGKQSCVVGGTGTWGTTCADEATPTSAFKTTADLRTGSYDFNCDGKVDLQFPNAATCNDGIGGCSLKQAGWVGPVAGCGGSGNYASGDCYRPSFGAGCQPTVSGTQTQGCR